ncbi:MAG: hypothetical protein L0H29_01765, partial [Sinobacteraceae bacterium]|nr:hypothetical protein [Nevskiaceae bacterium]
TAVSTQAVNINGIDLNDVPTKHHVTGTSERFIFLFIPFGIPRVGEAVDDALTKGGGDLMTNVSVYRTGWWFLVGEAGYKVTGDVLKTAGAGNGEAEGGQ